jgi:alanyl aminopeptidase
VAVQDGGLRVFDALLTHLGATDDAVLRRRLLSALGSTLDPELAMRARNLALDPGLRVNETLVTLRAQMEDPATRGDTWTWVELNFEELVERIGSNRAGGLPRLASSFCRVERAEELKEFFAPIIDTLGGGPRNLTSALERIRLCAALVEAQGPRTTRFFAGGG